MLLLDRLTPDISKYANAKATVSWVTRSPSANNKHPTTLYMVLLLKNPNRFTFVSRPQPPETGNQRVDWRLHQFVLCFSDDFTDTLMGHSFHCTERTLFIGLSAPDFPCKGR